MQFSGGIEKLQSVNGEPDKGQTHSPTPCLIVADVFVGVSLFVSRITQKFRLCQVIIVPLISAIDAAVRFPHCYLSAAMSFGVIRCLPAVFLGKTQKLLNRFSQNLVERQHIGPGRNHYIFGDNPSHVMLGLALEQVGGYLQGVEHWVCRWRPSHNPLHWVCFIRHLFNINNFAGSAALAEVCALLSAILVIREKHSTINYCRHE